MSEREEEKSFKKTSDKFSGSEKVYYFCTPPLREKREREKGVWNREKSFRNKRKKGFGKAEKVSTFADPNGRVLERGKEVKQAKAILALKKWKVKQCKLQKHIADSDDEAKKFF